MDEEKAGVEELLRRGEEVLEHASDETQREELRVLLLRLQSQYSAQRVRRTHADTHTDTLSSHLSQTAAFNTDVGYRVVVCLFLYLIMFLWIFYKKKDVICGCTL